MKFAAPKRHHKKGPVENEWQIFYGRTLIFSKFFTAPALHPGLNYSARLRRAARSQFTPSESFQANSFEKIVAAFRQPFLALLD
jgi:hypothetical protein